MGGESCKNQRTQRPKGPKRLRTKGQKIVILVICRFGLFSPFGRLGPSCH